MTCTCESHNKRPRCFCKDASEWTMFSRESLSGFMCIVSPREAGAWSGLCQHIQPPYGVLIATLAGGLTNFLTRRVPLLNSPGEVVIIFPSNDVIDSALCFFHYFYYFFFEYYTKPKYC